MYKKGYTAEANNIILGIPQTHIHIQEIRDTVSDHRICREVSIVSQTT